MSINQKQTENEIKENIWLQKQISYQMPSNTSNKRCTNFSLGNLAVEDGQDCKRCASGEATN